MKIDAQTGRVELPELGLTVTPTLTQAEFLASSVGQKATVSVRNLPWCSWNFGTVEVERTQIAFTLFFYEEETQMLSLSFYRSEWESSTRDPAQLEMQEAQRLLTKLWKAPTGNYKWGAISVNIDPRSGYASTTISYSSYLRRSGK